MGTCRTCILYKDVCVYIYVYRHTGLRPQYLGSVNMLVPLGAKRSIQKGTQQSIALKL